MSMGMDGQIHTQPLRYRIPFSWDPEHVRPSQLAATWDDVDIPRRRSVAEFRGVPPRELEFQLLLDGYYHPSRPNEVRSVASRRELLENMAAPRGGRDSGQEPFRVKLVNLRPLWVTRTLWTIRQLDEMDDDFIVTDDEGIVRCRYRLRLVEHREPSVAEIAVDQVREESPSGGQGDRVHTVVSGDTLWALSDRYLDDPRRWEEIADKNGIRDERNIQIGVELKIPPS